MSSAAPALVVIVEPKYCQACSRLFFRDAGSAVVYCSGCVARLAAAAAAEEEERRKPIPGMIPGSVAPKRKYKTVGCARVGGATRAIPKRAGSQK